MYNNQGFLVRLHRRQRKALYTPDQHCPVPMEQLENYRRTIARKADGSTEDFEEQLHDLQQGQTKRPLPGPAWTGETWFKVKKDIKPPKPRPPPTATLTTSPGILPSTTSTPTAPATRHTIKKPLDTASTQRKDGQQHICTTVHKHTKTKGNTRHNRRLLDQRRTHVEKSTSTTSNWPVHSTTDTWRSKRHQAHNRTIHLRHANKWQ